MPSDAILPSETDSSVPTIARDGADSHRQLVAVLFKLAMINRAFRPDEIPRRAAHLFHIPFAVIAICPPVRKRVAQPRIYKYSPLSRRRVWR
jgi:hypothetical protein